MVKHKGEDRLDIQIIQELQQDATQSSRGLAEKLGREASTIRRRVARLIKNNLIKIIAVPHPSQENYEAWAILGINTAVGHQETVTNGLAKCDLLYTIANCLGRFDIVALGHFPSMEELYHFADTKLSRLKGITRVETLVLMPPKKYHGLRW